MNFYRKTAQLCQNRNQICPTFKKFLSILLTLEFQSGVLRKLWTFEIYIFCMLGFKGSSCQSSITTLDWGFICENFIFLKYKKTKRFPRILLNFFGDFPKFHENNFLYKFLKFWASINLIWGQSKVRP